MNKFILTLAAAAGLVIGQFGAVSAQGASTALNEAKARLACGAGTVVASVYLPGGALQVTCSRPPTEASSTLVQATGLASPTVLGVVAAVVVLGVLTGSNGSGTTTTTTTALPAAK